jgi:hypothetical protein
VMPSFDKVLTTKARFPSSAFKGNAHAIPDGYQSWDRRDRYSGLRSRPDQGLGRPNSIIRRRRNQKFGTRFGPEPTNPGPAAPSFRGGDGVFGGDLGTTVILVIEPFCSSGTQPLMYYLISELLSRPHDGKWNFWLFSKLPPAPSLLYSIVIDLACYLPWALRRIRRNDVEKGRNLLGW